MIRRLVFWAAKRAISEGVRSGTATSGLSSAVLGGGLRSNAVGDANRLEVRPAITTAQQLMKVAPILAIVAMGAFVFRNGVVGLVIATVLGALLMGSVVNFRRRARVVITPAAITRVGVLGIRRARPRADVSAVLSAPILGTSGGVHTIFVLDANGRPIVRMNERIWALDDMKRVVRALDVRPIGPGKAVRPQVLAAEYPHVLRWYEQHPAILRVAGSLAFAAAAAAVVVSLL